MDALPVILLLGVFAACLALGVPVAYSIGLATAATLLAVLDPVAALTVCAQRMATALDSFILLAIPFFILAGQLMNRGGIARRLVDLAHACVGMLPGGLLYVNVLACMLFGAIAGSAVAAVAAIGGFMLPLMRREGYDRDLSAAVNLTSATSGLLIPPSNILIVYSLASGGVSIAALFLAGYLPGMLLGACIMGAAALAASRRGYARSAAVSPAEAGRRLIAALPSLLLIVIVMGGIVGGIFTATEASAIAVAYTLVLSVLIYREVAWRELPGILLASAATTSVVLLLIGASMAASWALSIERLPQALAGALLGISDNPIVLLLVINLILLLVGAFMDMTPAVLIFTPIFLPVVVQLGMSPVQFGVVMVMNLCIGLCTPPVGSVLFVGCGVAETTIARVLRPLLPMFVAMLAALLVTTFWPALSLTLPRLFGM